MVSIRGILASAVVALFAVPALAAILPADVHHLINGPLTIIGVGPFPTIIKGLADIVTTATTAIAQVQGDLPVPAGADATAIADAFRDFVRIHQQLLNILIGKAGSFPTVPLIGSPVAAALRRIEGITDDHDSLSSSIQTAIMAYSGLTGPIVKRDHARNFSA
ncbi:hypothetical protein B0T26DRAFT_756204 [Lasiosphaeria miniovina]|uniref:Uncharacterized protein n=1 Tax=Lasiosphaeria miniovina TaxID=1954250 RepID=A0AA39ZZX9_9PEZI|nr:uncharacterized protein B0T26DRAFT_756204 [Lasiosphaeria miniovina]KAK0706741.1 hypothetical protein B0T26DRAFT_756204 [Lasiosphaeria miniovina]